MAGESRFMQRKHPALFCRDAYISTAPEPRLDASGGFMGSVHYPLDTAFRRHWSAPGSPPFFFGFWMTKLKNLRSPPPNPLHCHLPQLARWRAAKAVVYMQLGVRLERHAKQLDRPRWPVGTQIRRRFCWNSF